MTIKPDTPPSGPPLDDDAVDVWGCAYASSYRAAARPVSCARADGLRALQARVEALEAERSRVAANRRITNRVLDTLTLTLIVFVATIAVWRWLS